MHRRSPKSLFSQYLGSEDRLLLLELIDAQQD